MSRGKTKQEVNCIICPESCKILVTISGAQSEVAGAKCLKGREYAIREIKEPRRIFTSTVRLEDSLNNVCPVKTSSPIKKEDWIKARELISNLKIKAPVKMNQVLVRNFLEENINLISTREMEKI